MVMVATVALMAIESYAIGYLSLVFKYPEYRPVLMRRAALLQMPALLLLAVCLVFTP